MKKIPLIDLVRSFSILAVMAHHLGLARITTGTSWYPLAVLWFKLWANGFYGVSAFFVISGFLITGVIASQPGGLFHPDLRDFYSRRAGRIFPLLTLVCLIGWILTRTLDHTRPGFEYCVPLPQGPHASWWWFSIATFSENYFKILLNPKGYHLSLVWGVLWSLAIEEQFYLLYPWILRALKTTRNLVVFLMLVIVCGPLGMFLGSLLWPKYRVPAFNPVMPYHSFEGFSLIAIGCLLFLAVRHWEGYLSSHPADCWRLFIAGLLLFGITYWHITVSIDFGWMTCGRSFIAAGVFLMLLGGLHLDLFRSSNWHIPSLPGKFSYGAYLGHSFALLGLWPFIAGLNEWAAFFVLTVITTAIAAVSFHFFEMPANLSIRKLCARN